MTCFPLHTTASIATIGLLLSLTRIVWPSVKPPQWSQLADLVAFTPETTPLTPLIVPKPLEPALRPSFVAAPHLLDDGNGALDSFYQALWRAEKREKAATVHIVHYGDSPTTGDLITGDIRSLLQNRYGNAGHGFVLVARPWAWYQHTGVELSASGWRMFPASRFESRDGLFGLGGVSMTGETGASSQIVFRQPVYTRFELWFLRQPEGGVLTVSADGNTLAHIATSLDDTSEGETASGFATVESPAGVHSLALHVDSGRVRIFGISAETAASGVVYDSLGLNGASVTVLTHMFRETHLAEQLRHRHPDLVIVNYGTNEADFAAFVDGAYEKELREAVRRIHRAVPEASLLLMSPMDRGYHAGLDEIETMPTIPRILAIQSRVARETGCGFFDTVAAMGGTGTMARWYNGRPRLVSADLIHPYPAGGRMIAEVFVKEVNAGLNRFKLRHAH